MNSVHSLQFDPFSYQNTGFKGLFSGFVLKGLAISFVALFIISTGFFALGAYNHMNSAEYWIKTEKLETIPDKFAIVTESEIEEYPVLRRALKNAGGDLYYILGR